MEEPSPLPDSRDSIEISERRLRRHRPRRGRSDHRARLLATAIVLGALAIMLIEVGRGFLMLQDVSDLLDQRDRMPSSEIKERVQRYAEGLTDHNPLVRNACVAGMKAVIRPDLGADPLAWREWWRTHGDSWDYEPSEAP